MRTYSLSAGAAMLAALALTGCRPVGPNYKVPVMPAPPAYSENGQNGNWTTATPADGVDHGAWWSIYGDTELNDFEDRCAKANQSIAAALHAYEQAHDLVRVSRSALFPNVSVGGGISSERVSALRELHPTNGPQDDSDFLFPINVSWAPDFWGGVRRQIESSATGAQASAADLANTRLFLQGTLAVTFFQLRGIDLQAQLLRTTLDAYSQALQLAQDRYHGGLASDSDVAQAQTQFEQTRSELVDLGVDRAQFEHAIAVLMGEPATGFHIAEKPLVGDPPGIPTGIPSELLQRRPDIAAAERRVASANALIGVAKAAFYPSITIGGGTGLETDVLSQLASTSTALWNTGVVASQTVYDAGRRRARLDFAVAQREQAAALYREQVLSAFRDVEDQLSALRILQDEATVTARAVDAAKRSTELSTLRYKGGLATYLEVLTNQTIELNNERTAAALVSRRIVASAQLQMALGGGWNATQLPAN